MNKLAIIEGLLFLKGNDGLSLEDIAIIIDETDEKTAILLEELTTYYNTDNHGLKLTLLGGKYKFTTKEEHISYYKKLVEVEQNTELTPTTLETLAIIAYNEPITRVMVDDIRGVSSAHLVRKLVNLGLIVDCGRSDKPGRPMLYKTTKQFLDHFGLASTSELPKLEINEEVSEEKDLFTSKYTEVN